MNDSKIKVLLVEPEKYPKEIVIDDSLEAMQEVVGGDIPLRLVNPKSKSLFQSCVYLPEKFIVIYRTYVFTQILSIDCPNLLQKSH